MMSGRRYTLAGLSGAFKDLARTPLTQATMRELADIVAKGTLRRMVTATDPEGKPHKPLTQAWVNRKMYGTSSPGAVATRSAQLGAFRAKQAERRAAGKRAASFSSLGWGKGVGGYSPDIWLYTGASRKAIVVVYVTLKAILVRVNTSYSGYADAERQVTGVNKADKLSIANAIADGLDRRLQGAR